MTGALIGPDKRPSRQLAFRARPHSEKTTSQAVARIRKTALVWNEIWSQNRAMKCTFFCVLVLSVGFCVHGATNGPPIRVSLCDVIEHPMDYSGKSVVMTVRVMATKDGTGIWNPSCKKRGIDILFDVPYESKPGLLELHQALVSHGLSDHPVIATLTGVFENNYFDEIRQRRKSVLKVIDAAEITQSRTVEHR